VSSSTTISDTNYYHQYTITFGYGDQDSSVITSGSKIGSYYQFGSSTAGTINSGTSYGAASPVSDWVDAGTGKVSYQTFASGGQRWALSSSPASFSVSSSTTISDTNFYHQYSLTVTASPSGATGGTFSITYTQFGTTYTNQQHTTTWNSWADTSTTATASSPQSPVGSYTFSSYSPSASVTMNQAQTITLVYMGHLGNTNTGTTAQTLSNYLRGIPVTATETGTIQSISAYVNVGGTSRHLKAALYTTSGTLIGSTNEVTGLSSGPQWVTMTFSGTKPALTAGTTYILVVWADSGSSSVSIYYSSTSSNAGRNYAYTYTTNWPSSITFNNDNYLYCIYCTYSVP
jgi:hypothetical protein